MSIASEITRLQQAKSDLAASIANKGVTVPAATTIDGYAALVDQIQQGGGTLPYDSEIEYLQIGSGDYLIYVGILGKPDATIDGYFKFVQKNDQQMILGSRASGGNSRFAPINITTAGKFEISFGNWYSTTLDMLTSSITHWKIVYNSDIVEIYKNDTSVYSRSGSYNITTTAPFQMSLFRPNWYNGVQSAYKAAEGTQIGAFKIIQDSVTVRDYIPVRIGQVGYLYDKVSGTLFGNVLSGAFTLGADKN
jgi:hypothetical protein